ncbi:MAG: O-succinylbenzoate synthase [Actinobacteria bacterium]|nr:O-succinylbenzoate synthase [Actinomycetota bacterium]
MTLPNPEDLRWYVVRLDLTDQIGIVTSRTIALTQGPFGWGEAAPLVGADDRSSAAVRERYRALRTAISAAHGPWPLPVRQSVPVNATVPAIAPPIVESYVERHRLHEYPAVKVKGGDTDTVDRVAAMRSALGPRVAIRVDANGAWTPSEAGHMLRRLQHFDLDYVEDPVASMADLLDLRTRHTRDGVRLAADQLVPDVATARRLRQERAADVLVIKPALLGDFDTVRQIVEMVGLPVVVTSVLGSSVGLSMDVAVACALANLWGPCGLNTAGFLQEDVTSDRLLPWSASIEPRAITPDPSVLDRASTDPTQLRHLGVLPRRA